MRCRANTFRLRDAQDRPISPMVVWLDQRALEMQPQLEAINALPDFRRRTGVPALGGQFIISHLMQWARDRSDWPQVKRISVISDELTRWFTGQHVSAAGAAALLSRPLSTNIPAFCATSSSSRF
jgi:sugar (pentulose or hexulose) kinase